MSHGGYVLVFGLKPFKVDFLSWHAEFKAQFENATDIGINIIGSNS